MAEKSRKKGKNFQLFPQPLLAFTIIRAWRALKRDSNQRFSPRLFSSSPAAKGADSFHGHRNCRYTRSGRRTTSFHEIQPLPLRVDFSFLPSRLAHSAGFNGSLQFSVGEGGTNSPLPFVQYQSLYGYLGMKRANFISLQSFATKFAEGKKELPAICLIVQKGKLLQRPDRTHNSFGWKHHEMVSASLFSLAPLSW